MDIALDIGLVIAVLFLSLAIELLIYNFLTGKTPREFFSEITRLGAWFIILTILLMSWVILSFINLYLPLWN